MDLHVHTTQDFTIDHIMDIGRERNDMSHTPHDKFISMAKKSGLKFAFGSDARNHNAGRLSNSKRVAKKCKLTKEDFYIPERRIT
jgi:hypothetical protein